MLDNLWYLKETLERLGAFTSFAKLAWMSKEQRQSSKLLEPGSFDVHKNPIILMIAISDHLELDMEVSDTSMETAESNDCRGLLKDDRDTNGVLITMQGRARFSHKDGQKFIDLFT